MLGSNWLDRGDAFFDYCSLHHQNSLTCLFMLRSENIVPVTLYNNNVSAVCWHNKTKATQLHRTTVYLSVTVASQSLIEKKQELSIPRPFFTSFWLDSWTVFKNASDEQWTLIVGTSLIIPLLTSSFIFWKTKECFPPHRNIYSSEVSTLVRIFRKVCILNDQTSVQKVISYNRHTTF